MIAAPPPDLQGYGLNPVDLIFRASLFVQLILLILVGMSVLVWVIYVLKSLQIGRLLAATRAFERDSETLERPEDLIAMALKHRASPGGRVVIDLAKRHDTGRPSKGLLLAVARRAIATEQQKASTLMPTLASIASSAPFIGLLGTVWGIMNAFMAIGVQKSASLPVVAPAIAEALIATAVGLFAAIPATIGYNYIDKRIGDMTDELSASAEAWAHVMSGEAGAGKQAILREPPPHPHRAYGT